MRVRQSDLKTWSRCPLLFRWQSVDGLPRLQSGSFTFGTIIHECVLLLETTGDLQRAIARFNELWVAPTLLGPEYKIDYYVRGTSWVKYEDQGPRILSDWWDHASWHSNLVLAREHYFEVPIGNEGNVLVGTADKVEIRFDAKLQSDVLCIVDFKTNKKTPTYDYLAEDLQFSAYGYASTRPEFWTTIQNGEALFARYRDLPRTGEWVQLVNGPKRMDCGQRSERHFRRVAYAVDALAASVALGIFVPNISGESCRFCDYRETCGLPSLDDNGNEITSPL